MSARPRTSPRRAILKGALAAIFAPRAARASEALDGLLARIARARAPIRTMQGPFTQTRTLGLLASDVRSSGRLILVRPDRLRWELAPPDAIVFFVGPEGLAYRDAQGEGRVPAVNARTAAALDDLRVLLGGDLAKLRQRWDLRVVRDDASGAELEATAHAGAQSQLRRIVLSLAPDLVRPLRAVLSEGPRDRTTIDFGPMVVDARVDPGSMRP
jgi:hypothetical protein